MAKKVTKAKAVRVNVKTGKTEAPPAGPARVTIEWPDASGVGCDRWLSEETAAGLWLELTGEPGRGASFEDVVRKGLSRVRAERRYQRPKRGGR